MKQFLLFIWEIIKPVVEFTLGIVLIVLAFSWLFTLFGFFLFFDPDIPEWIKWIVLVFDLLILAVLTTERTKEAYTKIYKN
jgi:hypothetical protein